MNFRLTILLLGLAVATKAQTLTDIEKRLRLLKNKVQWTYDTTDFLTLPKLDYLCTWGQNSSDFHHIIDLNKDGLKDLIYSGPCKPYYQTGIFLNDGLRLKKVYDSPGELVFIEEKTDRTIVNIFNESCCCASYSGDTQVTIWNDSHIDQSQIIFDGKTEIEVDRLTELKVKGVLRTSPELNDKEEQDDCSDQIIKGNHLMQIDKLTTVIQLSQSGEWKLVLYQGDKDISYIGWIK